MKYSYIRSTVKSKNKECINNRRGNDSYRAQGGWVHPLRNELKEEMPNVKVNSQSQQIKQV
jgi:hypothetical protein